MRICGQRVQLSNKENGIVEVWRQLFDKYRGGDAAVAMGGVAGLQDVQV